MKEFSDLIESVTQEQLAISLPKIDSPRNEEFMQTIWKKMQAHQSKLFKDVSGNSISYKQLRTEIEAIENLEITEDQLKAIKQMHITTIDLKDSSIMLDLEKIKK